jgi:TolB-like protein/AraC-like DNA-binding protein
MANSSPADEQFLKKLQLIIQDKMTNSQFNVSELAREMGMSRSNLHRKVSDITGKTVVALISEARLKKAMELLKEGTYTVSEVSWRARFGSVTYFNKCFHDYYGFPPGEARNRDLSEISENGKQNEEVVTGTRKKRNRILIGVLSIILLATVIVVLVLDKHSRRERKEIEKTIAVLPFKLLSDKPDKQYLADGMMDEILMHLSKIEALHVLSGTSTQQYKGSGKTMPEIGRELGAEYLLEGSFQKSGDDVRLIVQLIYARDDDHIWSNQYDRNWSDIFSVQSEVAQAIAEELKAVITPEEKQRIEKKPTRNMAAYNLFLQGKDLAIIAERSNDKNLTRQAGDFFRKAIQLDSTFSDAYMYLGWNVSRLRNDYDSALYYANRSLHFDDKNSQAYHLKGTVLYYHSGYKEKGEEAWKLAIKYNHNNSFGYSQLGSAYYRKGEYTLAIEYMLKALQLEKDPYFEWNYLYWGICPVLYDMAFYEEGLKFAEKIIEYKHDSDYYYKCLRGAYLEKGDYPSALQTALKYKNWKPDISPTIWIDVFLYQGDYKGALKAVEEEIEIQKKRRIKINPDYIFGYVFLKNGLKEKSVYHLEGNINNQLKILEQKKPDQGALNYFMLSAIYSAMGDKGKAMENLRKSARSKDFRITPDNLRLLKNHPILETIRNEPEFQELINSAEDKLLPEKKKIEKLLQEYWNSQKL